MFYPCRYWFTYQCVSWQDPLDLGEPCVKRIFGILQHESRNLKSSEGNICALHSGKLEPSTCSRFSNQRIVLERLIQSLNDPNLHLWNATVGLVLSVDVVTVRLGQQCLHLRLFLLQICLKSPLLMTRYYQIFNKYQIFNQQKSANRIRFAWSKKKQTRLPSRKRFFGAGSICSRAAWPDPAGEVRPAKVWRFYMERVAPKMVPRPVIIHICTLEDERRVHLRVRYTPLGSSENHLPIHHFQVRCC